MNMQHEFPPKESWDLVTEQELSDVRQEQANLLIQIEDPDVNTSRERIGFESTGHTIYAQGDYILEVTTKGANSIPRSAVLFGGEWGIDFVIGPPEGKQPKPGVANEPLVDLQRDFAVVEGNRRAQQVEFLNQAQAEVTKNHNRGMEEIAYQAIIDKAGKEDMNWNLVN